MRKSLVGLGSTRTVIGSAPWGAPVGDNAGSILDAVSVPAGRSSASRAKGAAQAAAGKGWKSQTAAGAASAAASIQPLGRASASRVSKILEGSMDAN